MTPEEKEKLETYLIGMRDVPEDDYEQYFWHKELDYLINLVNLDRTSSLPVEIKKDIKNGDI